MRSCFLYLFVVCLLSGHVAAQTTVSSRQERILNFEALLTLDTQGVLTVEEKITVLAQGDAIKRGIFRKLPLYRKDRFGDEQKVDYQVKKILHNSEIANYSESEDQNFLEIRIGQRDVFLEPGEHTYVITYATDRQIGFFDEFDELYWNATGTYWDFPIDKVTAKVLLPYPAKSLQESCYTGSKGSTMQNCTLRTENDVLIFETTGLQAQQGLTIATGFTKGVVKSPPPVKKPNPWIRNLDLKKLLLPLLLFLTYFLGSWIFLGKRYLKPVIIPTFEIPQGLSAATARYLAHNKLDNISFVASLIRLHVQKNIRIEVQNKQYKIFKETASSTLQLPDDEQKVLSSLFSSKETPIVLRKSYNSRIANAKKGLIQTIKSTTKNTHYFGKKWPFILLGILASIAFFIFIIFAAITDNALESVLVMCFPTSIILLMSAIFFSVWPSGCVKVFIYAFFSIFYIAIGFGAYMTGDFPMLLFPILFFLIAVPWIYIKNLTVLTSFGHQKRTEVLGLRQYIAVAEQYRFDQLNDPEKNLVVFEQLLPFAIAFGLENKWSERFQNILDTIPETTRSIDPILYHHHNLSNSMVSTVKSASYAPPKSSSSSSSGSSSSSSWSSGSSGGGSSGGGGGGGGGGGW